jgi:hypothetical protein
VSPVLVTIYEGDAALLERLLPRKEMRRTRDLVRLSSERVDDRKLAFDAPWFSTNGADGASDPKSDEDASDAELESDADADDAVPGLGVENDESDEFDGLDKSAFVSEKGEGEDEDVVPQSSSAWKGKRRLEDKAGLQLDAIHTSGHIIPHRTVRRCGTVWDDHVPTCT